MKNYRRWFIGSLLLMTSSVSFSHGTKHAQEPDEDIIKEQQAWGIAADPDDATRVIEVSMSDMMRFTPDALVFSLGETVKFIVKNDGQQLHEFVIGTQENNDEHAALMIKFPNMEHDEPHMAHVSPGEVGEIIWTFNQPGTFAFACLIAGHYQAGMVGNITVSPS